MDALSFYECGRHDVVSVPNGADIPYFSQFNLITESNFSIYCPKRVYQRDEVERRSGLWLVLSRMCGVPSPRRFVLPLRDLRSAESLYSPQNESLGRCRSCPRRFSANFSSSRKPSRTTPSSLSCFLRRGISTPESSRISPDRRIANGYCRPRTRRGGDAFSAVCCR